MAKIVYVCARNTASVSQVKKRVASAVQKLVPDNIPNAPCRFYDDGNIIYGISTYSKSILEKHNGVCMGFACASTENWWQPMSTQPDGNFAIFRSNDDYVEAIADGVASRTVWYYLDDKIFIAGTSQRAVITVAGKFNFDKRVIPWMLSSGTLGPSLSWCKNIGVLNAGGSVLLNRKTWQLEVKAPPVEYREKEMTEEEHRLRMRTAMVDAFKNFNVDLSQWTLPVSGGYDSRGILCLLKEAGKDLSQLNTITWGMKAALNDKATDAYVGVQVAKALSLQHNYFETDYEKTSVEKIFDRYIQCGEGRVDHIPGYLDGFELWKTIYESGSNGIIRGDETFGWHDTITEHSSRLVNSLTLCDDYSNLQGFEDNYGFEKQNLPGYLKRRENESVSVWTDRLYEEYTIPVMMSALNDLKLSYTEVISPLLLKQIMHCTHSLPDNLRLDKKLFKEMVDEFLPDVKFATRQATVKEENFFASPEVVELLSRELSAPYMKELFPEALLKKVVAGLNSDVVKTSGQVKLRAKNRLKKLMPAFIKEKIRSAIPRPTLDNGVLAFRIYMTGKTYRMLNDDVKKNDIIKCLIPA